MAKSFFGEMQEHESFGMLSFSRVSHQPATNLFGSGVRHHNTIEMRLYKAKKERHLNNEHYYGTGTIVEVELSPVQFAEAITMMNVGYGVPCTIRMVQGESMENCPETTTRQEFEKEFKETTRDAISAAEEMLVKLKATLAKSPTKAERVEMIGLAEKVLRELGQNVPFIQSQFNESLDKTVGQAKAEVEAFFMHRVHELGISTLQQLGENPPVAPQLIEYDKPESENGIA